MPSVEEMLDHKIDKELHHLIKSYKRWRFHNTFILIGSLVLFVILLQSGTADTFVREFGRFGYLGAFLAGLFFVSTFSVAPAGLLLFNFAQSLNPLYVALAASLGAVLGDHLIFQIIRGGAFEELRPIFRKLGGSHFSRLFSTPLFGWLAPIIGAIFIASPLPNEVGLGLLGTSRLKHWQILALSGILNAIGIFVIVFIAALV